MSIVFGNLTQNFVEFGTATSEFQDGNATQADVDSAAAGFRSSANMNAADLVYIGIAIFACTFIYMYVWVYTAEVNSKRIREKYLQSVLRQEIAFFDNVGPGEIASRIQTDTRTSGT